MPSILWWQGTNSILILYIVTCSISVTFHDEKDGSTRTVQVPIGQSLMEAAHANDIDLEGRTSL